MIRTILKWLGCSVVAAALVVLAIGVLAIALFLNPFQGPPALLTQTTAAATVDLRMLGEYCIGVSSATLREKEQQTLIWSLKPIEGVDFVSPCQLTFRSGPNQALAPSGWEDVAVVFPMDRDTFELSPGLVYELEICGNNGWRRVTCTERQIRFAE